jgi:WD40 repeat protein
MCVQYFAKAFMESKNVTWVTKFNFFSFFFSYSGGSAVSLVDDSCGPSHKDSIRAIRYGAKGKLFVSAGDDKLVKIWSTESWRCICTV